MTISDPAAHQHHGIDYIELSVSDVAQAKRFYATAFGWSFNDYGPDYAGIQGVGREVGGLCKSPSVRAGGPLIVLYSRELEATLASVREAGGELVKAPFEFPGGRRFHFRDPSGNELAVWSEK
jgi:predicted enzyme related to lactoylglutathione lyase